MMFLWFPDIFLYNEDKVKEYFTKIKQAKEADSPQERERLQSEAEQTMTDIANEFWGGMESIAKSEQFQQHVGENQNIPMELQKVFVLYLILLSYLYQ